MSHTHTTKGFTLIELLVVVAIIGVLASMIITTIGDAQKKARDARRNRDIRTIQTALEMYYLEHGRYRVHLIGEVLIILGVQEVCLWQIIPQIQLFHLGKILRQL